MKIYTLPFKLPDTGSVLGGNMELRGNQLAMLTNSDFAENRFRIFGRFFGRKNRETGFLFFGPNLRPIALKIGSNVAQTQGFQPKKREPC